MRGKQYGPMSCLRSALLMGASLLILAGTPIAHVSAAGARPHILAQADAPQPAPAPDPEKLKLEAALAAAEKRVENARAVLRNAYANNNSIIGVEEAKKKLRDAQKVLAEVRKGNIPPDLTMPAPDAADSGGAIAVPAGASATPDIVTEDGSAGSGDAGAPAGGLQDMPAADGGLTQMPAPAPPPAETPPAPAEAQPVPAPPATPPATPDASADVPAAPPSSPSVPQVVDREGDRVVLNAGGRLIVRHDDRARFEADGATVLEDAQASASKTVIATRPDGTQVVTTRDADGNILKRVRKTPGGQPTVLIDNPPAPGTTRAPLDLASINRLPSLIISIPRSDYIVEARQAAEPDLEKALAAPPVQVPPRAFSLAEIRRSFRVRAMLRRVDIDTITFPSGSADVPPEEVPRLDAIGRAIAALVRRDPTEIFLIEGHTDAVGPNLANLVLSDRRAQSVAELLSDYYGIPPENLITQGYGENYLKIISAQPEPENRRVTIRRITPLLRGHN